MIWEALEKLVPDTQTALIRSRGQKGKSGGWKSDGRENGEKEEIWHVRNELS